MAVTGQVEVRLADIQPVARFIAAVFRADATIRQMTPAEAAALPAAAAEGIAALQSAIRDLGAMPDTSGEDADDAYEEVPG